MCLESRWILPSDTEAEVEIIFSEGLGWDVFILMRNIITAMFSDLYKLDYPSHTPYLRLLRKTCSVIQNVFFDF